MLVSDLVTMLRLDIGDTAGEMLGDEFLNRCIVRAVYSISKDIDVSLAVDAGEISPDPTGDIQEMLLLRAHIFVCMLMRSITANNFSFSSGDKKVDKTKQPQFWADLQGDLEKDYKARVKQVKPDSPVEEGDGIMTTPAVRPVIYERGIVRDPDAPLK